MDTFYIFLKTRLLGISIHVWVFQIEPIYLVKIELEVEASSLSIKENKEEKK